MPIPMILRNKITNLYIDTQTQTHLYIYIPIYPDAYS